jgi:hypothetical protein
MGGILIIAVIVYVFFQIKNANQKAGKLLPLWGEHKSKLNRIFSQWADDWNAELKYKESEDQNYFIYRIQHEFLSFEYRYWPPKEISTDIYIPQLPADFTFIVQTPVKTVLQKKLSEESGLSVLKQETNDKHYLKLLTLNPAIDRLIFDICSDLEKPLKIIIRDQRVQLYSSKIYFNQRDLAIFSDLYKLGELLEEQTAIIADAKN